VKENDVPKVAPWVLDAYRGLLKLAERVSGVKPLLEILVDTPWVAGRVRYTLWITPHLGLGLDRRPNICRRFIMWCVGWKVLPSNLDYGMYCASPDSPRYGAPATRESTKEAEHE